MVNMLSLLCYVLIVLQKIHITDNEGWEVTWDGKGEGTTIGEVSLVCITRSASLAATCAYVVCSQLRSLKSTR